MAQGQRTKWVWIGAGLAIVIAAALAGILLTRPEAPIARGQCDVYMEQGCAKFIVDDGGEIEFLSGSILDVQSGATTGFGGDMLITGTLDVDGAVTLNSTLDVDGNISSGTGAVTVTDSVNITGAVDCDSTFNADGAVTLNSTVDIDGNISSGTGAITITDDVDITGTLQYGADDLYALGHATSGQQAVYGTESMTGTVVAAHGLTTVTFCLAVLGEDPETGAGDAAFVTVAVAGNVCTVKAWQDDWTTAATEVDVVVHWLVIGAP